MSASKRMNALMAVAAAEKAGSAPGTRSLAAANALLNMKRGSAPAVVSVSRMSPMSHPLSANSFKNNNWNLPNPKSASPRKMNNNVVVSVPASMFATPKGKPASPIVSVPAGMFNVNNSNYKVMERAPHGRNSKGRIIGMGAKGGLYVMVGKTKKYIKASPASSPVSVKVEPMGNVNSKGRAIMIGPKGGAYVMEGNKKIYTFRRAGSPPSRRGRPAAAEVNTGNKNSKGRVIYMGAAGGRYIKTNKGKRYLKK